MACSKCSVLGLVLLLAGCGSSDEDTGKTSTDGGLGGSAGSSGSGGSAGSAGSGGSAGQLTDDAGTDAAEDAASDAATTDKFMLTGTASGPSSDGLETVSCTLTLYYQNVVHDASGGWTGEQGGEVFRVITAGDQMYEFQALIGFYGTFSETAAGVELMTNDKPDPTAKPFWQELDVLKGTETGPNTYEGTWTCAPLMLDEPGFKDMKTYAPGTWKLEPWSG